MDTPVLADQQCLTSNSVRILDIDRIPSGATTSDQRGTGSTPCSPNFQGWSLVIRFTSRTHLFCWVGGSYPSAEMYLVYSIASTDWTDLDNMQGTMDAWRKRIREIRADQPNNKQTKQIKTKQNKKLTFTFSYIL